MSLFLYPISPRDDGCRRPVGAAIVIDLRPPVCVPFKIGYDVVRATKPAGGASLIREMFEPVLCLDFTDVTNIWYGLESLGNVDVAKAKSLASDLAACLRAAPRTRTLILRCDDVLTEDNLALLWYLYLEADLDVEILYAGALFPVRYAAVLDRLGELREKRQTGRYEDLHAYPREGVLRLRDAKVAPASRALLVDNPFTAHLVAENRIALPGDELARRDFLIRYAWEVLRCGATDLALHLLCSEWEGRLTGSAADVQRSLLAGMLMGLQRFRDLHRLAATASGGTSDPQRSFLRAYAELLLKDDGAASRSFAQAGIDEHTPVRETRDLYKLNAFSLLTFRRGEVGRARTLQHRIQSYSRLQPAWYTTNIGYTNELNLGRIARASGGHDEALAHFEAAFAQLEGIKQPADYLYHALLVADVLENKGALEEAARHWVRAVLLWSTLPCKNTMSWRIQSALLKRDFRMGDVPASGALCQVLLGKLRFLVESELLPYQPAAGTVTFRGLETDSIPPGGIYVQNDLFCGVSVPATASFADPLEETEPFRALSRLLLSILQPEAPGVDLAARGLLCLDLDNRVAIPARLEQVRCRCYRLRIQEVALKAGALAGGSMDDSVALRLHPSILRVEQGRASWRVHYRRYDPSRSITFFQFLVLQYLLQADDGHVTLHAMRQAFAGLDDVFLFAMQDQRLIHLYGNNPANG